ncbi:IMPACT family protein [Brytella acorum]|uniref:IMPACT family protein n=1 Tax=Brytella acorum TaxID=2959299 RepID=A0AA35UX23_9PROT|nr:YigZ family protein [Brytella acorum]MDF3625799.1 IMPACT family protein [Brytella acorum]CAI9121228.1 IMPACT family protein [Brytella acorum]
MARTLTGPATLDLIVRKSLFRAQAAPVGGEEEAIAFFDAVKAPDATHNCWAWRIGARYRSSDDGEPGGTAGRPILQAIEMQEFDGVMVVVTRWFGGIKLGAGGLVRAYGGAAASCLREAESVPIVPMATIRLHCPFALLAIVQSRFEGWNARQLACDFDAEGAWIDLAVPQEAIGEPLRVLRDLTRGQSSIEVLDPLP